MASTKRRKKSLTDCTNTPLISRPRRSCRSYVSSSTRKQNFDVQSPQPNNPLIDTQNQNEGRLIVKSSFATPTTVLPAVGSYQTPQSAEDGGRSTRVYSKCRERERTNLQVTSSCPPLGRGSVKSSTGERCAKVRMISTLGALDDLPVSGIPKMRAQKRRSSVPVNEGKYSLPENFIRVQKAHFAEVDAFVLQEED